MAYELHIHIGTEIGNTRTVIQFFETKEERNALAKELFLMAKDMKFKETRTISFYNPKMINPNRMELSCGWEINTSVINGKNIIRGFSLWSMRHGESESHYPLDNFLNSQQFKDIFG